MILINNWFTYEYIFQKLRVDLGLYIPQIKSKGRYEVNGQVLLLPILSHGEFFAEFSKKKELGVVHKCDLDTDDG